LEKQIATLADLKLAVMSHLASSLINDDGSTKLHQSQNFIANARVFIEYISVLKDVATGQPGRKSESSHLTIVQEHDKDRNVFIHTGHIAIIPLYNKSDKLTGRHTMVYRFFDLVTSKLIIYYLYIVVPILMAIHISTHREHANLVETLAVVKAVFFQSAGKRLEDPVFLFCIQ
jgi:hypothetical protein